MLYLNGTDATGAKAFAVSPPKSIVIPFAEIGLPSLTFGQNYDRLKAWLTSNVADEHWAYTLWSNTSGTGNAEKFAHCTRNEYGMWIFHGDLVYRLTTTSTDDIDGIENNYQSNIFSVKCIHDTGCKPKKVRIKFYINHKSPYNYYRLQLVYGTGALCNRSANLIDINANAAWGPKSTVSMNIGSTKVTYTVQSVDTWTEYDYTFTPADGTKYFPAAIWDGNIGVNLYHSLNDVLLKYYKGTGAQQMRNNGGVYINTLEISF